MSRTTESEVRGILLKDYDADGLPSLLPFIESAGLLVDQVSACAVRKKVELSTPLLAVLEKWVAAHLYCCSDRPLQEKATLSAKGKFQGETGKGLDSTYYGQTALILDPSGCLSALSTKRRASVVWLGRRPSEQTDIENRS